MNLTISLTDAMAADPAVQDFIRRTGATTRIVHDTVEDIHTSQASLGMAPMLLIGIGSFLLMPAGGGMFTLMGKAAVSSMIPQFTNGLVINDGNPFEAFKELTNPDNVRATVLAAATAGVLNGFNIAAPFGSTDLLEHATYAVQSAAVRAPLEMLISRRDMAETIRSNAMGIVANSLGAWAASHIGALYHPADGSAPRIDPITHKVLHFGGGAATAAIMGEDWVSGGAGAVAGEIAGEFYRNTFMRNLKPNTAAWNAAAQRGADIARISAIAFATACGLDPSIASCAAANAAANNGLLKHPAIVTRAVAELTDSSILREAADTVHDLDEFIDLSVEYLALEALSTGLAPLPAPYMEATRPWVEGVEGLQSANREMASRPSAWDDPVMAMRLAGIDNMPSPQAGVPVFDFLSSYALPPQNRLEAALTRVPLVGATLGHFGGKTTTKVLKPLRSALKLEGAALKNLLDAKRLRMSELAQKSSVFKYFGKDAAPAASSTQGAVLRMQNQLTIPGGGPIKPSSLPGTSASAPAASSSSSSAAQAAEASTKAAGRLHPRVRKINNRNPINADVAGNVYPLMALPKELRQKYPHSVPFTGSGHPDFSRYAIKKVQIEMTGKTTDFAKANKAAGLTETPTGYTWHHHQDGRTMQLIPSDIHKHVKHTGGSAIVKEKK